MADMKVKDTLAAITGSMQEAIKRGDPDLEGGFEVEGQEANKAQPADKSPDPHEDELGAELEAGLPKYMRGGQQPPPEEEQQPKAEEE